MSASEDRSSTFMAGLLCVGYGAIILFTTALAIIVRRPMRPSIRIVQHWPMCLWDSITSERGAPTADTDRSSISAAPETANR